MRSDTRERRKDTVGQAYISWLHDWPCCICELLGINQTSRTEAAHVRNGGASRKSPHMNTIPLCGFEHHREGRYSVHRMGRYFWGHFGVDPGELIRHYNQLFYERTAA